MAMQITARQLHHRVGLQIRHILNWGKLGHGHLERLRGFMRSRLAQCQKLE